jgi:hypothetical protein
MKAWEEAAPGNVDGVASALTTLAPLPPRRVWRPRAMFALRRLMGPPKPLARLSFIYFARTALVTGIEPKRAYIYFESNFNGRFDEYIDVFSYVVPQHMKRIWSCADEFPGPKPSTRFNGYIRRHDFPAAHFYCAYPTATATDVGRALDLRDALKRLARNSGPPDPEAFAIRWNDLWRPPPYAPSPGPSLAGLFGRDTNVVRDGQVYGFTVLKPIEAGQLRAIAAAIDGLGRSPSPFAEVPGTHFARLVILDRYPFTAPPHLLFSCVVDGDIDDYLQRLCERIPAAVTDVWRHCSDAPHPLGREPAAFARWLRQGQLQTKTFFGPYGSAQVHEVHEALRLRDEAQELARSMQNESPRVLKAAFGRFRDERPSCLR